MVWLTISGPWSDYRVIKIRVYWLEGVAPLVDASIGRTEFNQRVCQTNVSVPGLD